MSDKPKPRHRAARIRDDGAVSALCFARPRAIDLTKASWVLQDERVTCPKYLDVIEARKVTP